MNDLPPLRPIHTLAVLRSRRYGGSYDYWDSQSNEKIVASLMPEGLQPLRAKPDGRVIQGNTRITILMQRGYDVNTIPREIIA